MATSLPTKRLNQTFDRSNGHHGRRIGSLSANGSTTISLLRTWDSGNDSRQRLAEQFLKENENKTAVNLEEKYEGASLLLMRFSAWLRSSAISEKPVALPLRGLTVFINSAHGERFAKELVGTNGLQSVLAILKSENSSKEDQEQALRLLKALAHHGRALKESLAQAGVITLVANYLRPSMEEGVQQMAASLLRDIGTGNPCHFLEVATAVLNGLSVGSDPTSQLLAGYTFRMLLAPAMGKANGLTRLLGNDSNLHEREQTSDGGGSSRVNNGWSANADSSENRGARLTERSRDGQRLAQSGPKVTSLGPSSNVNGERSLAERRLGANCALPPLGRVVKGDGGAWKAPAAVCWTRTPFCSPTGPARSLPESTKTPLSESQIQWALEEENDAGFTMLSLAVTCALKLLENEDTRLHFEATEILYTLSSIGPEVVELVMEAIRGCVLGQNLSSEMERLKERHVTDSQGDKNGNAGRPHVDLPDTTPGGQQHARPVQDRRDVSNAVAFRGSGLWRSAAANFADQQNGGTSGGESGNLSSLADVLSATGFTIRGNPIPTIDVSKVSSTSASTSPKKSPTRSRPPGGSKNASNGKGSFAATQPGQAEGERPNSNSSIKEMSTSPSHLQSSTLEPQASSGTESPSTFTTQRCVAAAFARVYVERSSDKQVAIAVLAEAGILHALLTCLAAANKEHRAQSPDCREFNADSSSCGAWACHRFIKSVFDSLHYLTSTSELANDTARHLVGEDALMWLSIDATKSSIEFPYEALLDFFEISVNGK